MRNVGIGNTVSDSEIKELIFNSPSKSCDLDRLLIWLLKKCIDPILHFITAIVKRSLSEGVIPSSLKCAALTPLRSSYVDSATSVRNLCIILENTLKIEKQINTVIGVSEVEHPFDIQEEGKN